MPQSRSTTTRAAALAVALVTMASLVVAGIGPAGPAGAAAPVDAPSIIGPDGSTEGSNPILQWEPLAGVTKYRVQVSASSSFSSILWTADPLNVTATPPNDLPLGPLYWRVAGMDGSSVGPYAVASFTRAQQAGPQLLAPGDGSTLEYPSEPVVLRWAPVTSVKSYRVEVDDAPDFIGAQTITTDATNWALLTTQPIGQDFYWRVQGLGTTTGLNTQFSDTWHYELAWAAGGTPSVPTLLAPGDGASVTDVVFRWGSVTGAARYQIQVSPNGDWANNVTVDQTVKGTSYSPPVTLNNASYFWRVRALSVRNPADAGAWSPDGRQFTRVWSDVPVLRSPASGTVNADDYLLRWDPVPFASAYELQVSTDPNFSPGTFQTCTTNHTDWAPYWRDGSDPALPPRPGACALADNTTYRGAYLRHGERYYWRVRGIDQSQPNTNPTVLGRFSDVSNFIYLPLADGVPVATGPTGSGDPDRPQPPVGGVVEVPTLSWTPVRGAEQYEVKVYVNGTLNRTAVTWGTSYTPSLTPNPAQPPPTITWTIRALQIGAPGGSSVASSGPVVTGPSFVLAHDETPDPSASDPSTPELRAPAAAANAISPDFDWTPVPGAVSYELRLFPAGSNVFSTLVDHNGSSTARTRHPYFSAATPTRPIAPGAYEWQVVAFDQANQIMSSSERRALTVDPLPLAVPTAPADCAQGSSCDVIPSTPLLQWDAVPGAASYRVHIALDPEFTNVRHVYTTTQPALRPTEALPDNQAGQSYYWFVQPCRSSAVCGRFDTGVFGTARAFRKGSPPIALVSPADGAQVPNLVTFRWEAPSADWDPADANDDVEARHYRIQVSTRPDFATILDTAEVDQTTYTPHAKTYPEGPLYWRVQARDASGNYLTLSDQTSPPSAPWVVYKSSPPPVVTSPSDGDEVNGLPVVQWQAQAFAAGYQVEYYRNGDTAWTPSNRVQTTSTQLAADTLLKALPLGEYAYRVRRVDVDGLFGPWSSGARTFEVVGREPSPTAPANGTVFSRPRIRLEWEPVAGAVQYRVETSTTAGFASLVENQVTVMSAWSLVKSYTNGTVYWRVRALDAQGNVIGTSATRTFVHDLSRPTVTITRATAGPASALVQWTAQPGGASGAITSFVVTPYVGSTPGTPVTVAGSAREARVTGLVNGTTYRFSVAPYDANGPGVVSSLSPNVVPRAVAPFTTVDRFIDRQYQDLYGRRPTSAELTLHRNQMQGGTAPQTVINSLWTNNAHAGVMPQITRLYSAFYVRIPDYGGLSFWAAERRRGVSLGSVANTFARTAEFRNRYGTVTDAQFVDLVYTNVLGRPASASDRAFWTGELSSGRRTRGTVMIGFSEAAEYRNKFQHDINAALVYLEMLRRTPTRPERDFLSAALKGGQTLPATFVMVLALPEYATRAT